jgi:hypothetical protein
VCVKKQIQQQVAVYKGRGGRAVLVDIQQRSEFRGERFDNEEVSRKEYMGGQQSKAWSKREACAQSVGRSVHVYMLLVYNASGGRGQ